MAQLIGALSHSLKGCGFNSQSGHIPGLQVPSPIRVYIGEQPMEGLREGGKGEGRKEGSLEERKEGNMITKGRGTLFFQCEKDAPAPCQADFPLPLLEPVRKHFLKHTRL